MTDLVIGCPAASRSWIIKPWLFRAEEACEDAHLTPEYVFVGPVGDPMFGILREVCTELGRELTIIETDEEPHKDQRIWNQERFDHMTYIRNLLLRAVRAISPERFLSVDSDILLHPQALTGMVEALGDPYDVMGGATYMYPTGTQFPNCGWVVGMSGFIRRDMEHIGVIPVGVVMGIKLMSPLAYGIDYESHPQGEDIGISQAWSRAGLKVGWDNRHFSKHVMSAEALNRIDERCGF